MPARRDGVVQSPTMRRRLFTVLCLASLLLFAATCALWVRGFRMSDAICVNWQSGFSIVSLKNEVCISWWANSVDRGWKYRLFKPIDHDELLGCFTEMHQVGGCAILWHESNGSIEHGVIIPSWLPATVFLVSPSFFVWRISRRKVARGKCASCGYDLRATPQRCPECGTPANLKPVPIKNPVIPN